MWQGLLQYHNNWRVKKSQSKEFGKKSVFKRSLRSQYFRKKIITILKLHYENGSANRERIHQFKYNISTVY